jgi:hypothetical protein
MYQASVLLFGRPIEYVKRIVRMDLDGKRRVREDQLKQEKRICSGIAGTLVPDITDRAVVMARVTLRT